MLGRKEALQTLVDSNLGRYPLFSCGRKYRTPQGRFSWFIVVLVWIDSRLESKLLHDMRLPVLSAFIHDMRGLAVNGPGGVIHAVDDPVVMIDAVDGLRPSIPEFI